MIQVYKHLHNKYSTNSQNLFQFSEITRTRGHTLKLSKSRSSINTHAHFFTQRIVNIWNDLKEETVMAPSVDSFKNKLDQEWSNKPFKFNFEAGVL